MKMMQVKSLNSLSIKARLVFQLAPGNGHKNTAAIIVGQVSQQKERKPSASLEKKIAREAR